MDISFGWPLCNINLIRPYWCHRVLLCPSSIHNERLRHWHFYGLANLFMLLSQALFLPFKAQLLGWGNELWILVLIHQNNIHGDRDHGCSCGNEVLQDKKERRYVAK